MDRLRKCCKAGIKAGLFYPRRFSPFKRGKIGKGSAVILQYHSVSPEQASYLYINPSLSVAPANFEKQIAFVTKHFRVVSFDQLLEHASSPRTDETLFAVTFDDGYRDNFVHAFPVLRKYNVPALFYLTTECIDGKTHLWTSELRYLIMGTAKPSIQLASLPETCLLDTVSNRIKSLDKIKTHAIGMSREEREGLLEEVRGKAGMRGMSSLKGTMLNWDEVRTMRGAGMSFGSHTLSHPSLPYVTTDEAKREIVQSRESLMAHLDEEIVHFSYPNPGGHLNFNAELKQILRNAGYRSATTSRSGYVAYRDDFFELKRKGIYRPYSALPDFYLWIMKESVLQRWNSLPGRGWLNSFMEAISA